MLENKSGFLYGPQCRLYAVCNALIRNSFAYIFLLSLNSIKQCESGYDFVIRFTSVVVD